VRHRPACARRSTLLTESRGARPAALAPGGGTFHIEDVQDHVELGLMRGGHHEVARAYVLYRERRAQERARSRPGPGARAASRLHVLDGGQRVPLDMGALRR
jgi:ribonucleoside-diphosphate reductase alpha chain